MSLRRPRRPPRSLRSRPWREAEFASLDFETTGLDRERDAVVSFGGVLSLGNKLFAFPWSALRMDLPRKKVILNLDKKTLAKAPGFDKDHWPDSSTWNWGPAVPVPSPSATAAPQRAA